MRIPARKVATKHTTVDVYDILKPFAGYRVDGGYGGDLGIPNGWADIILDLHNKIVAEYPDYYITQIKEKFGGLRYYVGRVGDLGYDLISKAEDLSYKTCERCGRAGKERPTGWVLTLCWWDWVSLEINHNIGAIEVNGFMGWTRVRSNKRKMVRKWKKNERMGR